MTQNFTWLYIGTQDMWILFVLYIAYSKYGDIKLGKAHEKPEYDNFTWFAMLFSCGVAVGLYFYGVAEPMYYYRTTYAQKLIKPGFHANNDDGRAQQAMTITFFHWGVHAWSCYIVAALVLAFVSYRWNKPMTIRSAFFPLVGDVVNGVLGDCIDALSMACTTFGVRPPALFRRRPLSSCLHSRHHPTHLPMCFMFRVICPPDHDKAHHDNPALHCHVAKYTPGLMPRCAPRSAWVSRTSSVE